MSVSVGHLESKSEKKSVAGYLVLVLRFKKRNTSMGLIGIDGMAN